MAQRDDYNAYMRGYLQKRYADRRAAAVADLGGSCVVCGSVEDLEFDHIDRRAKSANIAKLILGKPERLYWELAKCQLLCKVHHSEKTKSEQIPHGGGAKGKSGCKCDLCRERARIYSRNYRMLFGRSKAARGSEGVV